jgi:hypothetical protein
MSTHDEDDIEQVVAVCINELLNIAAGVAELQTTDEACEEIYAMCDVVAAYFNIQRSTIETIENEDGSFTSRVQEPDTVQAKKPYTASVQLKGKPKLRVVDQDTPPKDLDTDTASPEE